MRKTYILWKGRVIESLIMIRKWKLRSVPIVINKSIIIQTQDGTFYRSNFAKKKNEKRREKIKK